MKMTLVMALTTKISGLECGLNAPKISSTPTIPINAPQFRTTTSAIGPSILVPNTMFKPFSGNRNA
jgi:hypothetical protein